MSVKVAKFGGSSLADANQFKKVRAIIEADKGRQFVVPSAPGKRSYKDIKITDMLFSCHELAKNGEDIEPVFGVLEKRYIEIADELGVKTDIRVELNTIRKNILGGATVDYAASRGEYLNGLILADYLKFKFIDAKELVLFNALGTFDADATQAHILKTLAGESNVVIPGFYGGMPNGGIRIFPRGGSDISGAIVARGVNADVYENWTDVSGFLMADPRIVENPKTISTVTYSELRELAYMGATVLHEDSIFPVRQACIPIHVCNTNAPDDAGTFIVPDSDTEAPAGKLTGIAGRCGFTIIAIAKDNMHGQVGFGCDVLTVLKNHGISFEHCPTGIDTMSVVIADSQIEGKLKSVVDDIMTECEPDSVEIHDNLALIATVGRGMVSSVGVSAKLFGALAKAGVNIRMIDQGSSEMNIIVGVAGDEFESAVRAIYEAWCND